MSIPRDRALAVQRPARASTTKTQRSTTTQPGGRTEARPTVLPPRRGPRSSPAPTRPVDLSHPLVTPDDVALLLNVKRKRIYELARRPNDPLPSVRIGGALRFVTAHVEDWVAGQRTV